MRKYVTEITSWGGQFMTTPSAFFPMEVQSLILLYVWIVITCAFNQQQMHELTLHFLANYVLLTDALNTTKQALVCSAKEGTEDGLDTVPLLQ